MNINIKHVDTFNFIKGVLSAARENISAACYDELEDVLEQMNSVPVTDDSGYFQDPKEQMQKCLDSVCPIKVDSEIASSGFWQNYNELRKNIGEAMGPVSYAAFNLARYIEEQNLPEFKKEHGAGTKWVWDFVKYYEKNWKF